MEDRRAYDPGRIGCYAGWKRYPENPLIGERIGNVSDPCVVQENGQYLMYYTHRYLRKILVAACEDGFSYRPFSHGFYWAADMGKDIPKRIFYSNGGDYGYALNRHPDWGWETAVCQPFVLKIGSVWHMWYTGKKFDVNRNQYSSSAIGHAVSSNGHTWDSTCEPVLKADQLWERASVQYPSVLWDEKQGIYRMWYSGGDVDEPCSVGYTESSDGEKWIKKDGPVFMRDQTKVYEKQMINACQVIKEGEWYYMFYSAWQDTAKGRICAARSRDGVEWQRHPKNPIITWGQFGAWDVETVFRPWAIHENGRWLMYYTGHSCDSFKIGGLIHEGDDLGFDE